MYVNLNGKRYELVAHTGVVRQPLADWAQQYRTTGQQQRSDLQYLSSWEMNQVAYGFGISRMDTAIEAETQSFWDSTLDTRNPRRVILPPLAVQCSISPSAPIAGGILEADHSNVYIFEKDTTPNFFRYYQMAGNTFGSLGAKTVPSSASIFLGRFDWLETEARWGVAWNYRASTDTNLRIFAEKIPSINTGHANLNAGVNATQAARFTPFRPGTDDIGRFGVHDDLAYRSMVYIATYGGAGSAPAPGLVASRGETEARGPYLSRTADGDFVSFSDGLYSLALATGVLTRKLDYSQQRYENIGKPLAVFDSDNVAIPIRNGLRLYDSGAESVVEMGPDLDDGMPSDKTGEISALCATDKYLFAALKPKTTANKATIIAWDKTGWHYVGQLPTANVPVGVMKVTTRPDNIERLFVLPTATEAVGNFEAYPPLYFPFPMTNPLTEASYTFATMGVIEFPENGLGLPEYDTGLYALMVEGQALGSGNKIEVYYGLNGAAPSTLLGTATQSGVTKMQFGTGLGVSGKTIRASVALTRGTAAGTTPQLLSAVLRYLKIPAARESFAFTIDLNSYTNPGRPANLIINDIITARDSVTLIPFQYGKMATKFVKVLEHSPIELEDGEVVGIESKGQIQLTVAELV